MRTYYLREDEAGLWPTVVCLARDEGAARSKIADALVDRGYEDPRDDPIGFDVEELDMDEDVIVLDLT